MVHLLNQPRDNIEAYVSLGIFLFLYVLYVEIISLSNPKLSFFQKGWGVFLSRFIVMTILYLLWFFGSRVITNYIFYFDRTENKK
jgi:hypothetical protein